MKLQVVDRDHPELHAAIEELRQDVHGALDAVRRLAWEIYPSLLLDRGLAAALGALGIPVEAPAIDRYPRDVETAVYFSCVAVLERAPAAQVTIRLEEDAHVLRFEARVDGAVLEPLPAVADRIGAVGGETTFSPSSIAGLIPLPRDRG